MEHPYNVFNANCPTRAVLDRIADRWTALIVGRLAEGPTRFSEIKRAVDGVSSKMLSQTLRQLERNGLVERTVYPVTPPRVDYTLTPLGVTLNEALAGIRNWAEAHVEDVKAAQAEYEGRDEDPVPWMTPTPALDA
jgi:DNA-binding HxlR family transcriptional regulator